MKKIQFKFNSNPILKLRLAIVTLLIGDASREFITRHINTNMANTGAWLILKTWQKKHKLKKQFYVWNINVAYLCENAKFDASTPV